MRAVRAWLEPWTSAPRRPVLAADGEFRLVLFLGSFGLVGIFCGGALLWAPHSLLELLEGLGCGVLGVICLVGLYLYLRRPVRGSNPSSMIR